MHNPLRRLSSRKPRGHLAMLLLTLVSSPSGFTLSRGRTPSSSNPLIVCARVIRQLSKNGCMALLLLLELLLPFPVLLMDLRQQKRRYWRGY